MVKTKFKRAVSLVMAAVLSLGVFTNIGTTAYAASGTKSDVYIMQLPRSGDTNNNGKWGHGELKFMNGWYSHAISTDSLRAMGSYSGNIAYCIEPGTGQHTGDTLTEKNEDYFNNLGSNGTISGDDIRLNIGRILQYGYCGNISTSWKSQNSDDADKLSHAIATQLLIWETIVGERDESFNHKSPGSYDAILDHIQKGHPLYSRIMAYYNSMSESVQKHTKVPSFCTKSSGSAKVNELKWDGSKYVTTLTDSNGVLGNYEFSANIDGVTFSKSGNKLIVSMTKAPSKEFTITATKTNGTRKGIVVWTDGKNSPGNGIQDVVSYSQNVSDPVSGFVKMKVSYGSCKIVKTSEDGKVDGIKFTITGNGVNQTVTTANGGKFQLDNLMPGVYTVTEQSIDKYVPQEVHRVTVVAGQVATVNFNNVLKRGNLQVIKSSEDNLVEGVKFHLYGTSLAGIAVDEYAVTDKNGVATFKDVLISGSTPYTLEEVDTAIRYVVPEKQTAPIKWNEVTNRDFTNILKKFSVTVTKSDREEGTAQGDAKLSGAVYGIYKGETLVDKYVTDSDGQFTTKEYVCDSDWTVREITPSEGYLLDKTVHKVGAEPKLFTIEHNLVSNDVTEQVMKGNIAIIKHTDDGETKIETPESGATFEIYLKSSGSFEAAEEDERDTVVCDENGFAQTKDMPYGVYTVHQTKGWEGREFMKDFDVFISQDGQTYRYLINNANFESYIKVVKVDAETGKTIPYAGAGFQIYDPAGNKVSMTFQRYLQYNTLVKNNLQHFDSWASTFGETVTAVELTPEGTGYRAKTRFAKFYNLPELMAMFKEVADIKTADMLALPVPEAHFHNVAVKPSEMQKEMVASLAERAEKVRSGGVDSSVDNMLKITNDGRKLALDQRMLNDMLPDYEGSKINACVDNIYRIWEETTDKKSAQLVFCDLSTPKNDGTFSVYNDIRKKLIERGVPESEVRFIHEADTDVKKKELFQKTRKGEVRVLLGSTQKMGAGTNVQDRLIALHDVDCPWRPADLEQRSGRIIRQGNSNPEVDIYRYVTEQTFDAYLYQLVEGKQKFASQIMTSKSPVRSAEDIDETALSYAEIKMLATGNPYIKEKMDLDIQVQKLKLLKSNFLSEKYALEDKIIKYYPQRITSLENRINGLKADVETAKQHPKPTDDRFIGMEVKGVFYSEKAEAGKAIIEACKQMNSPDPITLGKYRGFETELLFNTTERSYEVRIKGATSKNITLGDDAHGNITRIDNGIEKFAESLTFAESELENTKAQFETAKKEVQKPFIQEDELRTKLARLDELNILLNMDKTENEIVGGEPDEGEVPTARKEKTYER